MSPSIHKIGSEPCIDARKPPIFLNQPVTLTQKLHGVTKDP
jgi:hypothetical protein